MLFSARRRSSASFLASRITPDIASLCLATAREIASLAVVRRAASDFLKVVLFQAMAVFQFGQFLHYQTEELFHRAFDFCNRILNPLIDRQSGIAADVNGEKRPAPFIQYRNA